MQPRGSKLEQLLRLSNTEHLRNIDEIVIAIDHSIYDMRHYFSHIISADDVTMTAVERIIHELNQILNFLDWLSMLYYNDEYQDKLSGKIYINTVEYYKYIIQSTNKEVIILSDLLKSTRYKDKTASQRKQIIDKIFLCRNLFVMANTLFVKTNRLKERIDFSLSSQEIREIQGFRDKVFGQYKNVPRNVGKSIINVHGNYIQGDNIQTGNITDSNVALGRDASVDSDVSNGDSKQE
jgi:hypothetical protein